MKRSATAFLIGLVVGLAIASPAVAHKLKLFATIEGQTVRGYAFFIGGGRPQGSAWVAKDAAGNRIADGVTDAQGGFAFELPADVTTDVTVTVDTHEAHIASATLAAARFKNAAAEQPAAKAPAAPADDGARLAALVAAAVRKEVEPLRERLEAMDSRLRFVDILSGVFLILGLTGIGLWARNGRSG